jgi:predicted DNA-binding transcriptional regulator YafY
MSPSPRRLERFLEIDRLIRSPQRQTATSLALELEVTERTIQGDITFLKDRYSAPILFKKGRGLHYTEEGWRLPTVVLTQGELFALTLGARMLEVYAGTAYEEELQGAIARLAGRMPDQIWVNLQQLASERVLIRPGAELSLDPEVWQRLEYACQARQRVEMEYYTAGRNARSTRVLDPYILHFTRNNPYVTGFCHQRMLVRDFRVDRIRRLVLLEDRFEVVPDFDPQRYFDDVFQHELGGEAREMVIWFDAQTAPYIRERLWNPTQEIEEYEDGALTLRFMARGLHEVKRWILFYGKGAIALGPPELVEMVREEVMQMKFLYERVGHGCD